MSEHTKTKRETAARDPGKAIKRLFSLLQVHKLRLIVIFAITLVSIALELFLPLVMERAINALCFRGSMRVDKLAFLGSLGVFIGMAALSCLLGIAEGKLNAWVTLRFQKELREKTYAKVLSIRPVWLENHPAGDLLSRIMNDTELCGNTFLEAVVSLGASVIVITGCGIIMLRKNLILGIVTMLCSILSVGIMAVLSGFLGPRYEMQQKALGGLEAFVEETIREERTCAQGCRKEGNRETVERLSEDLCEKRIRAAVMEEALEPIMLILGNISFLVTAVFGGMMAVKGVLTLGALEAFLMYSRQFMEPVSSLSDTFIQLQNALAGAERIFAVWDQKSEEEQEKEGEAFEKTALEFKNVSFGYRRGQTVLKDVSFKIGQGEHLAVVGPTGAGKTTMTSLLLKLYNEYDGEILLGGRQLRDLHTDTVRENITLISQEAMVVEGSVLDNIIYAREGVTREEAMEAAKICGAESFIRTLPEGFDTLLSPDEPLLSLGQRQLLALTRAIVRGSGILILDEATGSVDAAAQKKLSEGLEAVCEGKICITIAHRLSAIVPGERILVLDQGSLVEDGTHEQLMAAGGLYSRLYESQFCGKEI